MNLKMKHVALILWISLSVAVESHPESKREITDRTPRRGTIPGLPIPAGLRPILSILGLLSLPVSIMGNIIPRLTQFIQNIPRPGGGGGGAGGLFQNLGNRPLGGRPLGSRPLANLLASGSSSSGSISAASTANGVASAAGSAASGGSFFFRRSSEVIPWDLPKIFSKLKNVYKKYKMDNPDCQRLLICEMYRRGTSIKIGNMADRFLRILRAEARLDGATTFTSRTKSTLKEFLKAAQHGLAHQECSVIYSRCSGDSVSAAKSRDEYYPLNKEQ